MSSCVCKGLAGCWCEPMRPFCLPLPPFLFCVGTKHDIIIITAFNIRSRCNLFFYNQTALLQQQQISSAVDPVTTSETMAQWRSWSIIGILLDSNVNGGTVMRLLIDTLIHSPRSRSELKIWTSKQMKASRSELLNSYTLLNMIQSVTANNLRLSLRDLYK